MDKQGITLNRHIQKFPLTGARKAMTLVAGFVCPALIMTLVLYISKILPFGDKSLLIMDMSGQYVEFYNALKSITSPSDLFFSWSKTLGSNYVGVYSYYSAGPLAFLLAFVPNIYMPIALSFLTIIEAGLSGLTMSAFLTYLFNRSKEEYLEDTDRPLITLPIILASTAYGSMAYIYAYSMCLMWLTGVIMLPLVLLGIERLIREHRPVALLATLFVMFVSNYYTAYMVGIFSAVYFIIRIVTYTVENRVKFTTSLAVTGGFAGTVIAAAGLSAFLLLPTYKSLYSGYLSGGVSTNVTGVKYNIWNIILKFLPGNYDNITSGGTPFVYVGAVIFILALAFLFVRRISIIERFLVSASLVFFVLASYFSKLDFFMHAFKEPNWFPYRWAFIISFLLVYMAFRTMMHIKDIKASLFVGLFLTLEFLVNAFEKTGHFSTAYTESKTNFFSYLLISLFLLLGWQLIAKKLSDNNDNPNEKTLISQDTVKILSYTFAVLIILAQFAVTANEMSYNGKKIIEGLDKSHHYESYEDYKSYTTLHDELITAIKKDMEENNATDYSAVRSDFSRSYNEMLSSGLRSISHYSSSYNNDMNKFFRYMGYSQGYIFTTNFGGTTVMDSILGIEYVTSSSNISNIDKDDLIEVGSLSLPLYYERLYNATTYSPNTDDYATASVFKNQYALTAPFIISQEIKDWNYGSNSINSHETLLKAMLGESGSEDEYFTEVQDANITGEDQQIIITMPKTGVLYAMFPNYGKTETEAKLGTSEYIRLFRIETDSIQSLGYHVEGDNVTITLKDRDAKYLSSANFYVLDLDVLESGINELRSESLNISEMKTGYLSGTIKTKGGVLFTSIPCEDGWTIYVDGTETEPVSDGTISKNFIMVELAKGSHTVEFVYTAPGLKTGATISIATVVLLAILYGAYIFSKKPIDTKRAD